MGRVLYIDAAGGLAGDMLAGALLDLGWPLSELRELAGRLGLEGVRVEERRAEHRGLAARRIEVLVEADQPRRRLAEVRRCVAGLPEEVAAAASAVFQRLAEAEARVHGAAAEEVHFHEVGAADALVDVAAFCGGLAWLGWPRVVCSPLPLGRGFVRAAHGELPLPAPAVVHLLEGAPVTDWPEQVETVTPTGAALAAALADSWGGPPAMRLVASGTGGGSRSSGQRPNVVRLWLGEEEAAPAGGRVVEIVCHLDDMSPEDLTLAMERLLAAGALDAAAAPLVMKKGRLGAELVVLARPEEAEALAALALEQTTSLGVRLRPVERRVLEREVIAVDSPWGPARVKRARAGGGWRYHPEADDVAAICRRTGLPPAEVRARLARLAQEP